MVHRGWCQEEWLYEHGDARQDGGHAVDALATIAVGIPEGEALRYQTVHAGSIALVPSVLQRLVQRTNVFPAETLHDEHHHVLLDHRNTVAGGVNGTVHAFHLLSVGEILGHGEHILPDGTVEGEGGVQHQCCLHRTVHVLVGIRNGDGAYGSGEASSDACHCEGGDGTERQQHGHVVLPPTVAMSLQATLPIEPVEDVHHHGEDQDEVDMLEGLRQEDAAQVALVGELAEHGGRGAPHRIAEVDAVAEVDSQCRGIDHNVHPAAQLLIAVPFLPMPGQQHQHDIGDVGDEDGRCVEHESSGKHLRQVVEGETLFEVTIVDSQVDDSRQEIDHVRHQQVTAGGGQRGEQSEFSEVHCASFLVPNCLRSSVVACRMALPMRSNRSV